MTEEQIVSKAYDGTMHVQLDKIGTPKDMIEDFKLMVKAMQILAGESE